MVDTHRRRHRQQSSNRVVGTGFGTITSTSTSCRRRPKRRSVGGPGESVADSGRPGESAAAVDTTSYPNRREKFAGSAARKRPSNDTLPRPVFQQVRDKGYSLENNLRYLQTPVLGRTNIVNGLLCMCMYVGEVCTMCLLYLKSIVRSVVLSIVCSASKAQHASSTVASSCTLQPKLPLCRGCIKKVNLTTSYPRHTHANKE